MMAPMERKRRVRVIEVVMVCVLLLKSSAKLCIERETEKKSIPSHVHASHPEMNIAHCSFVKLPNIVKSDLEDWSASFFGMRFRRK